MEEIITLEQLKSFIENLSEEQFENEEVMTSFFKSLEMLTKLVCEKSQLANKNKTNNGLTYNQDALLSAKKDLNALKECYDLIQVSNLIPNDLKKELQKWQSSVEEIAVCNNRLIEVNTQMNSILQEAAEKNKQKQSSGCFGVIIFLLGLSGGLLYLLMH